MQDSATPEPEDDFLFEEIEESLPPANHAISPYETDDKSSQVTGSSPIQPELDNQQETQSSYSSHNHEYTDFPDPAPSEEEFLVLNSPVDQVDSTDNQNLEPTEEAPVIESHRPSEHNDPTAQTPALSSEDHYTNTVNPPEPEQWVPNNNLEKYLGEKGGRTRKILTIIAAIIGFSLTSLLMINFLIGKKANAPETASKETDSATEIYYPKEGRLVSVSEAKSHWVETNNPEKPYVPELTFRLKDHTNGANGALRILFATPDNKLSQPRNIIISKGKIVDDSGSLDGLIVQGSDGLSSKVQLDVQEFRKTLRWSVTIYEGPHPKASFNEFTQLLTIPVEPRLSSSQ